MPSWIVKYWVEWLFGIVTAGLLAYIRRLSKQIKKERTEQQALRNGMRSLLRRQIIFDCEYAIREGYCPAPNKDTIEDMYRSYTALIALGSDEVVTQLHDQMMNLPTMKGE